VEGSGHRLILGYDALSWRVPEEAQEGRGCVKF
jgi:hypothetical protein